VSVPVQTSTVKRVVTVKCHCHTLDSCVGVVSEGHLILPRDLIVLIASLYFCSVMLCIAQTMLSQDVCLSIRLSVTRQYCVETAKHIIFKLFHRQLLLLLLCVIFLNWPK